MKKAKKATSYQQGLLERLKDPEYAMEYLNACISDLSGDGIEVFLDALGHVARARGVKDIAEQTKKTRDTLYKALNPKGNPTMRTLGGTLDAMGFQLQLKRKQG